MITSIESALVVDDDVLMREFIVETLRRNGIHVTQAANGLEAKKLLDEKEFDISFIDLKMPGMDGMQVLSFMKDNNISTMAVIVTAFGTVEQAVEAMKKGAHDFLMKPFSPEQVELIIKRAREWINLRAQNAYLQEELGWKLPKGKQIVGQSRQMLALMDQIEKVASSSATVLIVGESGTGKELVAHAIHSLSDRRDGAFIRMNCASVPDSLMDSELFGHEKGSFTSAVARRLGRFELATGGTLLLDEITEMKLELQSKLLRVLQEQEFERVGGVRTIKTDCRVIATTNRDMQEHLDKGNFRRDLFYRLNVLPINVPPLRERTEDVPLLVNAFLNKYMPIQNGEEGMLYFSDEAMGLMAKYYWPGNVRELENLVQRLAVMATGPAIGADLLPVEIRNGHVVEDTTHVVPMPALNLSEMEKTAIIHALRKTGGNRQSTADMLGISVRTLRNKLNQYKSEGVLQSSAA